MADLTSALESLKKAGIRIYDTDDLPSCDSISTGSLVLDSILGEGQGVLTRRLTQFFSKIPLENV